MERSNRRRFAAGIVVGVVALILLWKAGVSLGRWADQMTREAKQQWYSDRVALPAGASKVQDLCDGWQYFELAPDGKTRKFLLHRCRNNPSATETILQLRDD